MPVYVLYNDDTEVATFKVTRSVVTDFTPLRSELLPMQIKRTSADGFTAWLRERAIDLNNVQHRNLMKALIGSRDKLTLALKTHMFSISDTFSCFEENEFIPRLDLCSHEDQNQISDFILLTSDTSVRKLNVVTPNASTDGSFSKTWRYENDAWWLYKIQPVAATEAEVKISHVLEGCKWDSAEYTYTGEDRTRVRTKNFLREHEFFEPYESFRFCFDDPGDDDVIIMKNFSSLGQSFETAWKRILLADALFLNTDRHMRNFGVIRSSITGEVLRLAPNFDNNQAYMANPGGVYSSAMLNMYMKQADQVDSDNLRILSDEIRENLYFSEAYQASRKWLK